jgi:hypothetical protein
VYKQPGRTATGNSFSGLVLGIHKFTYETGDNKLIAYTGTEPPGRGEGRGGRTGTVYEAEPTTTPNFQTSGLDGLSAGAIPQFSSFNDTWIMVNGADTNYVREANAVSVDTTGDGNSNWTKGNWRPLGLFPPSATTTWSELSLGTGVEKRPASSTGAYTTPGNAFDSNVDTFTHGTVNLATITVTETFTYTGTITDLGGSFALNVVHQGGSSENTFDINPNSESVTVSYINATHTIEVSEDSGANWTTISTLSTPYTKRTTSYTFQTLTPGGGTLDVSTVRVRATTTRAVAISDEYAWAAGRLYDIVIDNGESTSTFTSENDFFYMITERYTDSDEVTHESIGSSLSVAVTPGVHGAITIDLPPAATNAHTQYFVIYRSLDAAGQGYPFLYEVAEVGVWEAGGTYADRISDIALDSDGERPGFTVLTGTEKAYEVLPILYPTNEVVYTALNGAPPLAKLARLFQGSMVYVPTRGNRIHYSIPTNISSQGAEQVPSEYYLEFLTPLNDDVVSISAANAGRSLIVYFERYTMLVNYLPQATDPGVFDTRVKEYVSTHRGCGGRLLSLELDVGAGRTIAVAVDKLGLWSTDGVSALQEWSRDLDWDTLMSGVDLTIAELVNNAEMRRIELLYTDTSGDRQELHFFYGRLKQDNDGNQSTYITGPHPMGVRCRHYDLDEDGEWQGWSGGAGGTATLEPTGMDLWLRADDLGLGDTDLVSTWTGRAPGNPYAFVGGTAHYRTNQLNGHDAVEATLVGQTIAAPAGPEWSGVYTIAVVYKQSSVQNAKLFGNNQNNPAIGFEWMVDYQFGAGLSAKFHYANDVGGVAFTRQEQSNGDEPSYHIAIVRMNSTYEHYMFSDAVDRTLGTPVARSSSTDNMSVRRVLGISGTSGAAAGTQVLELIEWRSYFTDEQVVTTYNYLADRYGFDGVTTSDVYIERSGDLDAALGYDATGAVPFQVKTGDMYLGNLGRAAMTIFGYPKFEGSTTKSLAGDSSQAVEGTFRRDGASAATTKTKAYTVNTQKKIYWSQYADRHTFEVRDISNTSLPALVGYEIEVREGGPSRDK